MVPESPRLLPPHAPTSSADVGQDTRLTILPEGSHGGMVGNEDGFDELLIECMAKLGVTAGKRTRESLRRALRMWTEGIAREETSSSEATVSSFLLDVNNISQESVTHFAHRAARSVL